MRTHIHARTRKAHGPPKQKVRSATGQTFQSVKNWKELESAASRLARPHAKSKPKKSNKRKNKFFPKRERSLEDKFNGT